MKNIYLITNFRITPLLAIFHLIRSNPLDEHLVVSSERWIENYDYGEFLPKWQKKIRLFFLRILTKSKVVIIPSSKNQKNYKLSDLLGIESSLKSITCDSAATPEKYLDIWTNFEGLTIGAIDVVNYLKSEIGDFKFFLFNGRGASQFPIALYAFDNKIKINYIEYSYNSYVGFNLLPFSVHNSRSMGIECVNQMRLKNFYLSGVERKHLKRVIYDKINNNYESQLNESSEKKFQIVVFLSSDHEYQALHEGVTGFIWKGNLALCEYAFKKYGSIMSIAVRAHPNQRIDINATAIQSELREYCMQNSITYIEADSNISSHHLILHSEMVVVEYSSVAYDAIYLGKSVDIFGEMGLKYVLQAIPAQIKALGTEETAVQVASSALIERNIYLREFGLFYRLLSRFIGAIESRIWRQATQVFRRP
jgi:hypothetical protein